MQQQQQQQHHRRLQEGLWMSLVVIGTTGSSSCSRSSIADDGRTEGLRVSLVLMGTTGRSYSDGLECWASWVGVTASNHRPRWRSWLGPGMRSEPIRAEGQVMSHWQGGGGGGGRGGGLERRCHCVCFIHCIVLLLSGLPLPPPPPPIHPPSLQCSPQLSPPSPAISFHAHSDTLLRV